MPSSPTAPSPGPPPSTCSGEVRRPAPPGEGDVAGIDRVRNIGIIAHIDAGKTTFTERLLFYSGVSHKMGEVHDGDSQMDYLPQERERGITITAAVTQFAWMDAEVHLIDTPGHVDFTIEVERSLRVLDGAVAIFCAVGGVEPQSEVVWRQADRHRIPRLAFVNKLDRPGADFDRVLSEMGSKLSARGVAATVPLFSGGECTAVADLVTMERVAFSGEDQGATVSRNPLTEEETAGVARYREALLEAAADADDAVAESYLAGEPVPAEMLRRAIRKGTIEVRFFPVFAGAALRNKGIQPAMDGIVHYLPSPREVPPASGDDPRTGVPATRDPSPDAPFSALAFKVVSDPFVGRLVYFRVYSGTINAGTGVLNSTRDQKERIGRLLVMHANAREEVDKADTGSIIASLGLKNTFTGDTLCDPAHPVLLENIKFPEPVISISIEPKTRADQDKMVDALQKLADEDPTFKVTYNEETGQNIIAGMGELHLDVIVSRMLTEHKVAAKVGQPRVAYRETITTAARAEGRFVRQSGGRGQYGHVKIDIEPNTESTAIEVTDDIRGGTVPKNFVKAAAEGIKEAANTGAYAGYPMVGVKVSIYDGSYHDVDSNEMAFKTAGSMALKAAVAKASPVLLEPIMKMEVMTP
ncbi:MAG TPA: elongation factor G, partial [Deltaproteobacteria bacterium]|nr:elongation factor G [Deltaproteobacteria bacterium]